MENFKDFLNGGIDGLLKDEYGGRSFKLIPEQRKELARHLDDKRCILRAIRLRPMTRRIHLLPHIYLIVDNAGYCHARAMSKYLASGSSRIHLWFLPPYSPNLNLIERVWKFFRKKVMNNRYYATFREFTEEALMFFECLSDYANEPRTLLTHNFQLLGQDTGKTVTTLRAYPVIKSYV